MLSQALIFNILAADFHTLIHFHTVQQLLIAATSKALEQPQALSNNLQSGFMKQLKEAVRLLRNIKLKDMLIKGIEHSELTKVYV